MIELGDVRDRNFKVLRSSDDVSNCIDGHYLKLNDTGMFEVFDEKDQRKDISTNFTGSLLLTNQL